MADRGSIIAAIFVACALSTCARTRTVALSYGPPSNYSGLDCVEDATNRTPLVSRAVTNGAVTFVVDFFDVPANINATGEVLLRACGGGRCTPIARRRSTIEIRGADLGLGPNVSGPDVVRAVSRALATTPVTRNAPDGTVILRVVATTQPASELDALDGSGRYASFVPSKLVGCSITPPVDFDSTESPVFLSLPIFGDPCELAQVALCAGAR
ncbi:MAG: hypothetical protein JNK05_30230 [Myxococcales bacterium]|nr:hypothetical protein [Myxococcales bacterium]